MNDFGSHLMLHDTARRRQEVTEVYQTAFLDLVHKAAIVHRMYNDPQMVSARRMRGLACEDHALSSDISFGKGEGYFR